MRESLDRRSFIITLVFCSLLVLVCASIGFEPHPLERAVERQLGKYFTYHSEKSPTAPNGILARAFPVTFRAKEVRETEAGWSVQWEVSPVLDFQKLVRFYLGARGGEIRQPNDPIPGVSPDGLGVLDPPSLESMAAFIESRMSGIRFPSKASIESVGSHSAAVRLEFRPDRPGFFLRGHRVNVFFGAWKIDMEYTGPAESVYFIQKTLAAVIVGWAGILAAIVLTAGFIPNMLQKGMVDLVLSRPIQRWKVFLLKYVGGLTYVSATATFLIGGCWLALGLRSGTWAPGFLMAIPLLVFVFAAVYSVSAFIGLHKANITEAIMASILAWLALTSIGSIRSEMHRPGSGVEPDSKWTKAVDLIHAVTPPLGEIYTAVSWFLMKANDITPERFALNPTKRPWDTYPEVRWAHLFGVTGAWMALLLGLSCWTFSRRDY